MRTGIVGLCCGLLAVTAFAAEPASSATPANAGIDPKLAALVQRQVELSFTMKAQLQKNENLCMDPKYTSPEIEKIRKRMETLKQEMVQLQVVLRQRVEELPEARAEIAKVETYKAENQALTRQIEKLQKK